MLVLNRAAVIETLEELDSFCKALEQNAMNKDERKVLKPLIGYLSDCFFIDKELREFIPKEIGPDYYPIIFVDVFEDTDFESIDISLHGEKEPTERDKIIFDEMCTNLVQNKKSFIKRLQEQE